VSHKSLVWVGEKQWLVDKRESDKSTTLQGVHGALDPTATPIQDVGVDMVVFTLRAREGIDENA
jgi:hypothetical protein